MTATSEYAVTHASTGAGRSPFLGHTEDGPQASGAAWWEFAACRSVDADLFCVPEGVPLRQRRAQERKAKAICDTCPVREACLDEALSRDEHHGVWGGLDADERRELRRRRVAGAA